LPSSLPSPSPFPSPFPFPRLFPFPSSRPPHSGRLNAVTPLAPIPSRRHTPDPSRGTHIPLWNFSYRSGNHILRGDPSRLPPGIDQVINSPASRFRLRLKLLRRSFAYEILPKSSAGNPEKVVSRLVGWSAGSLIIYPLLACDRYIYLHLVRLVPGTNTGL
jgi:hypothetical protein